MTNQETPMTSGNCTNTGCGMTKSTATVISKIKVFHSLKTVNCNLKNRQLI